MRHPFGTCRYPTVNLQKIVPCFSVDSELFVFKCQYVDKNDKTNKLLGLTEAWWHILMPSASYWDPWQVLGSNPGKGEYIFSPGVDPFGVTSSMYK